MVSQILLNIFIALMWVMFQDEAGFQITTFLWGYLVGIGIVFLMHRFFGDRFYLARVFAFIKLMFIFNSELIKSSITVMKQILSPKINVKPGIFRYETQLRGDWEITTISLLLTLTPGSVVMEVTPERDAVYVHGMDVEESKEMFISSLDRFEKAIMEVTR